MNMIHDLTGLPADRRTAFRLQLPTYRPTQPCRNGHLAPMETRRQRCTQCLAASDAKAAESRRVAASNARKVARMEAKMIADAQRAAMKKVEARDAADTARREAREARARQKAQEKAAATRAANKEARQDAATLDDVSPYAVREAGQAGDDAVPW